MNAIIRAQNGPWYRDILLFIGSPDRKVRVKDIVLEKIDEHDCIAPAPSFHLEPEQAQTLLDDLWQCGVRPTEGAGTAGSMRATERHLEDMRAIAFAKLNIKPS
jgi:hypothetical protein